MLLLKLPLAEQDSKKGAVFFFVGPLQLKGGPRRSKRRPWKLGIRPVMAFTVRK